MHRKTKHQDKMFIPFERAVGSRQDLKFDGCVALFWNRLICLDFLRGYINCPKSAGVLDKSLYTRLRSNEFVALLRVNVLLDGERRKGRPAGRIWCSLRKGVMKSVRSEA